MSPVEILAECVNGGVEEGSSLPAPVLIVSTGVIGILFSMYVAFFQTCPVMHVPHIVTACTSARSWLLQSVSSVPLDVTSAPGSGSNKDSAEQNKKVCSHFPVKLLPPKKQARSRVSRVSCSLSRTRARASFPPQLKELYDAITLGAGSFITAEYKLW